MLRSIIVVVLTTFIFSLSPASAGEAPSFEDKQFACKEVRLNALLAPRISPSTKQFETSIKRGARKKGIDFCGRFTYVRVGFTGAYQINFIVDRKTGEVHEAPVSTAEVTFKKSSSLFVVNAESGDSILGNQIEYYHWDGKKFNRIYEEMVAKPLPLE